MADLSTQELDPNNAVPTFTAAASGGDSYQNGRDVVLLVQNGDTAGKTVTLVSQVTAEPGISPSDHQVSVPAGGVAAISLEGNNRFNDDNDRVQVTYSAVTSVEVAAVSL